MRLLIIASLVFIYACTESHQHSDRTNGYTPVLKTKSDSLYHQVMAGHDTGMARMGRLIRYKKEVQAKIDSATKVAAESQFAGELRRLYDDLQNAETGMNEWMTGFKADSAEDNEDARVRYLETEKAKVEKVRDDILSSLRKFDSLVLKRE
jgi:hypothetical protein